MSISGDASIKYHSSNAKSDIFLLECRIVLNVTFPTYENTPITRINSKTGLVREKNIARLFLLHFACFVAHSLHAFQPFPHTYVTNIYDIIIFIEHTLKLCKIIFIYA